MLLLIPNEKVKPYKNRNVRNLTLLKCRYHRKKHKSYNTVASCAREKDFAITPAKVKLKSA